MAQSAIKAMRVASLGCLIAASILTGVTSVSTQADEPTASFGLRNALLLYADGTEESIGNTDGVWKHWLCSDYEQCPGGPLRKENGNYTGCSKDGSVCVGDCKGCSGSRNFGNVCLVSSIATDRCNTLANNPYIQCGEATKSSCIAFQVGTGGGLVPPNGCGCTIPMTAVAGSSCKVKTCAY